MAYTPEQQAYLARRRARRKPDYLSPEAWDVLLPLLSLEEGFRERPYDDAGKQAIGFGHQIKGGEPLDAPWGEDFSRDVKNEDILDHVPAAVEAVGGERVWRQLDPRHQAAFASIAFQWTPASAKEIIRPIVAELRQGDLDGAVDAFLGGKMGQDRRFTRRTNRAARLLRGDTSFLADLPPTPETIRVPAAPSRTPRQPQQPASPTEDVRESDVRQMIQQRLVEAGRDASPEVIDAVYADLAAGRTPRDPGPARDAHPLMRTLDPLGRMALGAYGLLESGLNLVGAEDAADVLAARGQRVREGFTPQEQRAQAEVAASEGFFDTAKALLTNPSQLAGGAFESVPQMIPAMRLGGLAVRALAPASRVGQALTRGIAGEGAVGALTEMGDLRREDAGLGTMLAAGAGIGAAKGVAGGVGHLAAGRLGVVDPDALFAQPRALLRTGAVGGQRVAIGGAVEGVEEQIQEAGQQVVSNLARGRPMFEGVPEAAAQGLMLGATMGGAFAAAGERVGATEAPRQVKAAVRKDVREELREDEDEPPEEAPAEPAADVDLEPDYETYRTEPEEEREGEAADYEAIGPDARGKATSQQIFGAVKARQAAHRERLDSGEELTAAVRADLEHRVQRGDEMLELLRNPSPRLDRVLTNLGYRTRTAQRTNAEAAAQAAAREVVAQRVVQRFVADGGDLGRNGAEIVRTMTDRELQKVWQRADHGGTAAANRMRNPAYQEDALYNFVSNAMKGGSSLVRRARARAAAEPAERTGTAAADLGVGQQRQAEKAGVATEDPLQRRAAVVAQETEPTSSSSALFPATGQEVAARWTVLDAADVHPSHDPATFGQTDPSLYPPTMQGRDYAPGSQAADIVEGAVASPQVRLLTQPGPSVASGPPTVLPGGAALAGNQRAMIIKRVYAEGGERAAALRAAVVEEAGKLGLTIPDSVAHPVLTRMLDEGEAGNLETLRALNQASDVREAKAKTPVEDAAGRVGALYTPAGTAGETITLVNESAGDQTLSAWVKAPGVGRKLAAALVNDGVISDAEKGAYFDDAGSLSEDGERLVTNVVKAAAMGGDAAAVEALPAEFDKKLDLAWHSILAANQNVPLTGMMADFARLAGRAREAGQTIEEASAQQGMFGGGTSDALRQFSTWIDQSSAPKIREAMDTVASANLQQPDIFTGAVPTVEELVREEFNVSAPWVPAARAAEDVPPAQPPAGGTPPPSQPPGGEGVPTPPREPYRGPEVGPAERVVPTPSRPETAPDDVESLPDQEQFEVHVRNLARSPLATTEDTQSYLMHVTPEEFDAALDNPSPALEDALAGYRQRLGRQRNWQENAAAVTRDENLESGVRAVVRDAVNTRIAERLRGMDSAQANAAIDVLMEQTDRETDIAWKIANRGAPTLADQRMRLRTNPGYVEQSYLNYVWQNAAGVEFSNLIKPAMGGASYDVFLRDEKVGEIVRDENKRWVVSSPGAVGDFASVTDAKIAAANGLAPAPSFEEEC